MRRQNKSQLMKSLKRASAWDTGADLEMKVGRFCLKLVHKLVVWTYVMCQSFRFNDLFSAKFWISAPQWSSGLISVHYWPLFNLSFSNVQLTLDQLKPTLNDTTEAPKGHAHNFFVTQSWFSKMGVCILKMGVCFTKMGVCFFENGSSFFRVWPAVWPA